MTSLEHPPYDLLCLEYELVESLPLFSFQERRGSIDPVIRWWRPLPAASALCDNERDIFVAQHFPTDLLFLVCLIAGCSLCCVQKHVNSKFDCRPAPPDQGNIGGIPLVHLTPTYIVVHEMNHEARLEWVG